MKKAIRLVGLSMFLLCSLAHAEEITTIKITDTVLQKNTKRLGINMGGAGILKKQLRINFEGVLNRRCVLIGPECTNNILTTFMLDKPGKWLEVLNKHGGRYEILSGPQKGLTGKITKAEVLKKRWRWMKEDGPNRQEKLYGLYLDKPIPVQDWKAGLLIEASHLEDGVIIRQDLYPNEIGTFSTDTPPGSFGYTSLEFGPDDKSGMSLRAAGIPLHTNQTHATCSFWAKAVDSSARLSFSEFGQKDIATVEIEPDWKAYRVEVPLSVKKSTVLLKLRPSAAIRIDDICLDIHGQKNPTVIDDRTYEIFKYINPSIIRTLQTSGGDVENYLQPRLKQYAVSKEAGNGGRYKYDVNSYYQLCKQMDAEPWYNLPGTVTKEGVLKYMEFIGAPADVGFGKLRADGGYPEPWTETLSAIHVEFGNEIWNFMDAYYGCGYSGPDHWEDIIQAAKASPYYKENVIFHVGGRTFPTLPPVPKNVPSADRFTWAPYVLHKMSVKDVETLGTPENWVKWAFTRAIDNATNLGGGNGEMFKAQKELKKQGVKGNLSIYEMNHHLMFYKAGDLTQADAKTRNTIMATLAGGVNIVNAMLMHLKYNDAVDQCYFSYGGGAGRSGSFDKKVMWWSTHSVMEDGTIRYSPQSIGLSAVNKVMGGDLLETIHTGANPVFTGFKYKKVSEPIENLPILWSYAFKQQKKSALIVVNLDLHNPQKIKVEHNGAGANARSWTVTADQFTDHNMDEENVKMVETKLGALPGGTVVEIPACSMVALSWDNDPVK